MDPVNFVVSCKAAIRAAAIAKQQLPAEVTAGVTDEASGLYDAQQRRQDKELSKWSAADVEAMARMDVPVGNLLEGGMDRTIVGDIRMFAISLKAQRTTNKKDGPHRTVNIESRIQALNLTDLPAVLRPDTALVRAILLQMEDGIRLPLELSPQKSPLFPSAEAHAIAHSPARTKVSDEVLEVAKGHLGEAADTDILLQKREIVAKEKERAKITKAALPGSSRSDNRFTPYQGNKLHPHKDIRGVKGAKPHPIRTTQYSERDMEPDLLKCVQTYAGKPTAQNSAFRQCRLMYWADRAKTLKNDDSFGEYYDEHHLACAIAERINVPVVEEILHAMGAATNGVKNEFVHRLGFGFPVVDDLREEGVFDVRPLDRSAKKEFIETKAALIHKHHPLLRSLRRQC
eukprot:gene22569-34540_t